MASKVSADVSIQYGLNTVTLCDGMFASLPLICRPRKLPFLPSRFGEYVDASLSRCSSMCTAVRLCGRASSIAASAIDNIGCSSNQAVLSMDGQSSCAVFACV